MRTLQEKYNGIQEGKFSKENFLADARKELPNLVTRFNGYDDAVQILKNRGMIQEAEESFSDVWKHTLETDNFDKLKTFLKAKGKEGLAQAKAKLVTLHGQAREKVAKAAGIELDENLDEAKQPKPTKKGLADYRYKPTNEMDKYPYEQILRGLRVELEGLGVQGTPTAEEYAKALAKVSKNLAKDSIFYTNQVAGVNPKVDLHDKMVPVTAKNSVDTFNGMKKAELKEGFKKLIKKVLSEEVKDSEVFELYGDDNIEESVMGDIYQIAKEHDRFEHFVQAVEEEFGPVKDIAELEDIFNATRGEDDIDYGDENFSDPLIDGEDLFESKSLKDLL